MIGAIREKATDAPITSGAATFLNPHSYLSLRSRPDLLANFDALYLDGISMVRAVRAIGVRVERRSFDMTSLAPVVLGEASRRGSPLAVVGGEPGVAEKALAALRDAIGSFDVPVASSGYFADGLERSALMSRIRAANPEVVLVGMGAPHQEEFVRDLLNTGWRGTVYTCGGFLHQTADSEDAVYYPVLFDRLNLRWLYRILREPQLLPRYLLRYPWFALVFLWDIARSRSIPS